MHTISKNTDLKRDFSSKELIMQMTVVVDIFVYCIEVSISLVKCSLVKCGEV